VLQYAEYRGPDWGGYSAVAVDPADPASVWTDAQNQLVLSDGPTAPDWSTFAHQALATTAKAWPGSTPAIGTRHDQTASLIYRRADGKLERLHFPGPCPDCWTWAQYFTPAGGTNAAPALDPQFAVGYDNLFTRRPDHHIWYGSLDGGPWHDLGGYATSAPTAIPEGAAGCALAVFIRRRDGAVYRTVQSTSGTWTGWHSLAGRSAPALSPARSRTATATKPSSSAAPTTASTGNTAATAARPGAAGRRSAARPTATRPPLR
jgi:hypothetical protein